MAHFYPNLGDHRRLRSQLPGPNTNRIGRLSCSNPSLGVRNSELTGAHAYLDRFDSAQVPNAHIVQNSISHQTYIEGLIEGLTQQYFDFSADAVDVQIERRENADFYLRTGMRPFEIFKSPQNRKFKIIVNPTAIGELPEHALEAILMHELVHIQGYRKGPTSQGLKGVLYSAWISIWGGASLFKLERQIDMRVLEKAFDPSKGRFDRKILDGLKTYRTWIYGKLRTQKALNKKKETYLQPGEIDRLREEIEANPILLAHYIENPPKALNSAL